MVSTLLSPFTVIIMGLQKKPLTVGQRVYYYYITRIFFAILAFLVQYLLGKVFTHTLFINPTVWLTELGFIVPYMILTGLKQYFHITHNLSGEAAVDNLLTFESNQATAHRVTLPVVPSIPAQDNTPDDKKP